MFSSYQTCGFTNQSVVCLIARHMNVSMMVSGYKLKLQSGAILYFYLVPMSRLKSFDFLMVPSHIDSPVQF